MIEAKMVVAVVQRLLPCRSRGRFAAVEHEIISITKDRRIIWNII